MFAIYFHGADGGRAFIAAVDDRHSAVSMAKLLSRQDPRDVMVIENRPVGDTAIAARYRRGVLQMDETDSDVTTENTVPREGGAAPRPTQI